MAHQVQDAYIVAAVRTPVGKAPRGIFRTTRPDDLLTHSIRAAVEQCPELDPNAIGDLIVGTAMPEAEQGMNVARIAGLLAGLPNSLPAVTVNRFCASGLQAVAWAADRIRLGAADAMLAAGTESMSMIPMGGHSPAMNPRLFATEEHLAIAYGMGLTAERVATRWKINREDQDSFALTSHQRALQAMDTDAFDGFVLPYNVSHRKLALDGSTIEVHTETVSRDEGPRPDTSLEALAALKPVFSSHGSVTAGNSSQMSDGAAALVLMSESMLKSSGATPLARFVGYSVAGVAPEFMGIGPKQAIPKVLAQTGITLNEIDWVELNEAFAAQSLAVMRGLDLDPDKVNPQGGAIALGHPLGATGAIRSCNIVHGLRRNNMKYGMVTMCIGTGMGAAAVFEAMN